jgi:hypothetical protein
MATGGGGAPVTRNLRRGVQDVQREVRKVVRWFIRVEGGRRPRMAMAARSSAMAAMATRLRQRHSGYEQGVQGARMGGRRGW